MARPATDASDGASRGKRLLAWAVVWGANMLLWFLFAGKLSLAEALVGSIAAGLAWLGAAIFQRADGLRLHVTLRMLLLAWRIPLDVLKGAGAVLACLAKRLLGREAPQSVVRAMKFDVGGDSPFAAARRSLAITYTTLAPNDIVLGFDREQNLMLYHQFSRDDDLQMAEKLGGRR